MATNVQVPPLGDSVSEAVLLKWHKNDGDSVTLDEPLCELETDKANVDLPSTGAGVFQRSVQEGQTVRVGQVIATIGGNGVAAPAAPKTSKAAEGAVAAPSNAGKPTAVAQPPRSNDDLSPSVRRLVEETHVDASKIKATGPGGRLTKEDVQIFLDSASSGNGSDGQPPSVTPPSVTPPGVTLPPAPLPSPIANDVEPAAAFPVIAKTSSEGNGIRRVPMSKIRKKIAERLVQAQQTAAILTTFNEVDLAEVMSLRTRYKEKFEKTHGVGLGFMSFFARAVVLGLKQFPLVNARIDGSDILYNDFVNLGIAVSTERGLVVPVLRNAEKMGFAKIESEIKRLAAAARDGKLGLDELSGGTFTITNGGVFGSLLSTPIISPPQSGILGMHTIQKRPVAVNDQVVIRPMMYIALSYDHRIVDGKDSVSFLVRLKELLEDPSRLMLEV